MREVKTVLITGAAGNLGTKLRRHLDPKKGSDPLNLGGQTPFSDRLENRYELRLLDIAPGAEPAIQPADLSRWDPRWADLFQGVDAVVHLAADPTAQQTWPQVIGPNIDAVIHVFQAAVRAGVKRVVYASSNHVMGGYMDDPEPARLTTDLPPRPGARYVVHGEVRDSTAYAAAKLFGERLGQCTAETHSLSVIAVRIGWVRPDSNRPQDVPPDRGPWFRLMWLSNRDFCQLMECCLRADLSVPFAVINGMSNNAGMRWDIESARRLVGYAPQDDVARTGE